MYSESELAKAVEAGILAPAQLDALRAHIAAQRGETSTADDEQIRLVTGFNDIFVTIAVALVIFASASVGGGLAVALASWGMAEVFTRQRRMALPSIVLLLSFTLGLGLAVGGLVNAAYPRSLAYPFATRPAWQDGMVLASGALAAGLGAAAHWWRFRVAITVAAAVASLVALLLAGLVSISGQSLDSGILPPAALLCGFGVFTFAMRWDLGDPARVTQKSDIAFWLHLLAAPLIAHPLFYWMGILGGGDIGAGKALGVVAVYLLFALVALAVDRRALLVSALAYVLVALGRLLEAYGVVETSIALTALVIGSALLALSAFWGRIRAMVLGLFPSNLVDRLPKVQGKP
jgi:hypothetical protein